MDPLSDPAFATATIGTATATIDGATVATGNIQTGVTIPTIAPGKTAVVTFDVTFGDITGTEVSNIACSEVDVDGLLVESCSNEVILEVEPLPLTAVKSATDGDDNLIQPGDTFTYSITVTNPNTYAVADVEVSDPLDDPAFAGATFGAISVTVDGVDVAFTGTDIQTGIVISSIPASSDAVVSFDVTFTNPLPAGTDTTGVINTAEVIDPTDPLTPIDPSFEVEIDTDGDGIIDPSDICPGFDDLIDTDLDGTPDGCDSMITAVKSATDGDDNLLQPGDTFTYSIAVTNNNTVDAANVEVSDPLSDPAFKDAVIGAPTVTIDNVDVPFTGTDIQTGIVISNIPATKTAIVSFDVTFANPLPVLTDADGVVNTAEVIDPTDPTNPIEPIFEVDIDTDKDGVIDPEDLCPGFDDSVDTDGDLIPDGCDSMITAVKSATDGDDNLLQPGDTFTYSIAVTNNSAVDAANVEVSDPLSDPAFKDATIGAPTVTIDGTDVPFTGTDIQTGIVISNIPAAKTAIVSFDVTFANPLPVLTDADGVINTAEVIDPIDPTTPINPDFEVDIDTDKDGVIDPEDLCPGFDDGADTDGDLIPDGCDSMITAVKSATDNDDEHLQPGDTFTYSIEVTNTNSVDVANVEVSDALDDPAFVGATIGTPTVTIDGTDVPFTGTDIQTGIVISNIPAGETAIVSFDVTFANPLPAGTDPTGAVNTASVIDPVDPTAPIEPTHEIEIDTDKDGIIDPADICPGFDDTVDSDGDLIPDGCDSMLTAVKSATDGDDEFIQPGDVFTYSIEVTNENTLPAYDVVVTDPLNDPAFEGATIGAPTVTIDGAPVAFTGTDIETGITIEEIPADETAVVSFSVTFANPLPAGTDPTGVINTASVVDPIDPTNPIDPSFEVDIDTDKDGTIDPEDICPGFDDGADADADLIPDGCDSMLTAIKSSTDGDDNLVQAGDTFTYNIEITNTNTVDVANVEVSDPLSDPAFEGATIGAPTVTIDGADVPFTGTDIQTGIAISNIPAGKTAVVSFDVTFTNPLPAGTDPTGIINTAEVIDPVDPTAPINPSHEIDIDTDKDGIIDPSDICPGFDDLLDTDGDLIPDGCDSMLTAVKGATDGADNTVQPGDTFTYSIEVTNNNTVDVANVEVSDPLSDPAFNGATIGVPTVTIDGVDVAFTGTDITDGIVISNIPAGKTAIVSFDVTFTNPLPLLTDPNGVINVAEVVDPIDPTNPINPDFEIEIDTDNDGTIDPDDKCVGYDDTIDTDADGIPDSCDSDLSAVKSATDNGDDLLQPGETFTYSIEVTNSNTAPAYKVEVSDPLSDPAFEGATIGAITVTIDGEDVKFYGDDIKDGIVIEKIPAGKTAIVSFDVTFTDPLPAGTDPNGIINTASVINPITGLPINPSFEVEIDTDGDGVIDPSDICPGFDDTTDADADGTPDGCDSALTAVKSATDGDDNLVQPGDTFTYSIAVTNENTLSAYDVVVTDPLSDVAFTGATLGTVTVTIDGVDVAFSGTDIQTGITIEEIPAGKTAVVSFDVTFTDPLPTGTDPNGIINTASVVDPIAPTSPIEPSFEVDIDTDKDGVIDPEDLCVGFDDTVDTDNDGTPDGCDSMLTTTKSATDNGDNFVQPGETFTYSIEVTNHNTLPAYDVVVTDTLADAAFEGATIGAVTVTIDGVDVAFTGTDIQSGITIEEIPGGKTAIVSFDVTFTNPLPAGYDENGVINTAEVVDPIDPTNPQRPSFELDIDIDIDGIIDPEDKCLGYDDSIDSDGDTIPDSCDSDISAVKSATDNNDGMIQPGETFTYSIEVTNNTAPAYKVEVSDPLDDPAFEGATIGAVTVTIDGVDVQFTGTDIKSGIVIEKIPAGKTAIVSFDVTFTNPLPTGTDLNGVINTAEVVNPIDPTNPINPSFEVEVDTDKDGVIDPEEVCPGFDDKTDTDGDSIPDGCDTALTAVKDASDIDKGNGDMYIQPGETFTYSIAVTNNNTYPAKDVVVTDALSDAAFEGATIGEVSVTLDGKPLPYTGTDIQTGIVIAEIPAGATTIVSFDVTFTNPLPAMADMDGVVNYATVTGPTIILL